MAGRIGATMDIPNSVVTAFVSLIAAGAGGYFGSYFKKKGENLATREDIAEITRTQKEIEAKVSDRSWDRQKQWEMKRDALVKAIQVTGECFEAILRYAAYRGTQRKQTLNNDELSKKTAEQGHAMTAAVIASNSAAIPVTLLCDQKSLSAINSLVGHLRQTAAQAFAPDFIHLEREVGDRFEHLMEAAVAAAREELGLAGQVHL